MSLDSIRPVYGIAAKGLVKEERPLTTIKEMVSGYVDYLDHAENLKDFDLAGWSFGALVAYEMTLKLIKRGQEVALTLIDAYAPGKVPTEILAYGEQEILNELASEINVEMEGDESVTEKIIKLGTSKGIAKDAIDRIIAVFNSHMAAYRKMDKEYGELKPVHMLEKATVIYTQETQGYDSSQEALGWSSLISQIELHEVEGKHRDAMVSKKMADFFKQ